MTKVVVSNLIDGKVSKTEQKRKAKLVYEGAANKDGSYKKGWCPFIQSAIIRNAPGIYTVIHNLKTNKYSISAGLIKDQGSYELSEITDVSFKLSIKINDEPTDADFRFCISLMDG
jgi:hypothetical protein